MASALRRSAARPPLAANAALLLATLLLAHRADASGYSASCKSMLAKSRSVINAMVWPGAISIVVNKQLPAAWGSTVSGDTQPNGSYNTTLGVIEYFYGLSGPLDPNPQNSLDRPRITDIEFIWMACNPDSRIVAAEVFMTFLDGRGNLVTKLDLIFTHRYTKKTRQICGYSMTSKRQGLLLPSPTSPVAQAGVMQGICGGITAVCVGPNLQFASFQACVDFMQTIPFGDTDNLDQNSVQCRGLHLSLAIVDPDVHCPHVGPTGGGKCIPHGPESVYAVKKHLSCE